MIFAQTATEGATNVVTGYSEFINTLLPFVFTVLAGLLVAFRNKISEWGTKRADNSVDKRIKGLPAELTDEERMVNSRESTIYRVRQVQEEHGEAIVTIQENQEAIMTGLETLVSSLQEAQGPSPEKILEALNTLQAAGFQLGDDDEPG